MNSNNALLIRSLQGKKQERIPFWFMRQAGRYLPEYRELRSRAKNFLDFCYTPAMAAEATLQPIRRFGMSGAIIFSDILVVPDALGANVNFQEGKGPVLTPVKTHEELDRLSFDRFGERLSPVYEALRLTRASLPQETALIGFVGAPWTIACYMVQGISDKNFHGVREKASADAKFFSSLIALLTEAVTRHAVAQIQSGAQVIQIFDSWAGVLNEEEFRRWCIEPAKRIVAGIRNVHPAVPVIGFPRMAGKLYGEYAKATGVNAVSVDQSLPPQEAREQLAELCVIQGNLDPELLCGDKNRMLAQAEKIIVTFGDKSFVFNLGHGILPQTSIENVEALSRFLKAV
ncbi:MAG: uroporphyrinogen decarboxylase [Pseudomonadota bacterium]|nr:uroporphyrinogen decarboxylase [Pseudomonadota bacterium]